MQLAIGRLCILNYFFLFMQLSIGGYSKLEILPPKFQIQKKLRIHDQILPQLFGSNILIFYYFTD